MIRRQTFEHRIKGPVTPGGWVEAFASAFGRTMNTKATEFIVIKALGCSRHVIDDVTLKKKREYQGYTQLRINTTDYFICPDGSRSPGISNDVASFPFEYHIYRSTSVPDLCTVRNDPSDRELQARFMDVVDPYILPGQNYELIFTLDTNDAGLAKGEHVVVGMDYELWDGSDAVLANSLLINGVRVTLENVDILKQQLINAESNTERKCTHPAVYIGYAEPGFAGINAAELDLSGLDLHDDANADKNRKAETRGFRDFKVYCKACHAELPFEAYEISWLMSKFKLPKDSKFGRRVWAKDSNR